MSKGGFGQDGSGFLTCDAKAVLFWNIWFPCHFSDLQATFVTGSHEGIPR